MGVNLSADSLMSPGLVALIADDIQMMGAKPSNLVFEITDTALMRDVDKGELFANSVVALGCSVALDDFGTGFGTFTHVKKLPISHSKSISSSSEVLSTAFRTSTSYKPS